MKKVLLLTLIIVGTDQLLGFALNQLYLHTTSGDRGGVINGALRQKADVLVLGSSRAKHHVVPKILQEKLSLSVFNAGVDGQDYFYAIMLLDLWTRSHRAPKAILLHVDPTSLTYSKQEMDRTSIFSGYFWENPRVREILLMRGKYEWIKYVSSSYRFNGKVLQIAKTLVTEDEDLSDGYVGLQGSLGKNSIRAGDARIDVSEFTAPFWNLKLNYLFELASYCRSNGIQLILFHTPRLREDPAALAAWSERLSLLRQSHEVIEFLDLSERTSKLFADRQDLYKDGAHLNSEGAEVFSTVLAEEVARRLGTITAKHQ